MIKNYAQYIMEMIIGGHKSMIFSGRPNESEVDLVNITLDDPDGCGPNIILVDPNVGKELIEAISEKIPSLNRDQSFCITISKGDGRYETKS